MGAYNMALQNIKVNNQQVFNIANDIKNDENSVPSNATILNEIAKQTVFNEHMWSLFKIGWSHSGVGTYNPTPGRNAIIYPNHFDEDVIISIENGYKFAVQYFDGYQTGSEHMIRATEWYTTTQIIPANSYWGIIVAKLDDSDTTAATTKVLTFCIKKYKLNFFNEYVRKYQLFYRGILKIDNTSKTISLDSESNLIACYNANGDTSYYLLGAGYSLSYKNMYAESSLYCLQYNIDDNILELNSYYKYKEKYPTVATLNFLYGSDTILSYSFSFVRISIDNHRFDSGEISEIQNLNTGELISLLNSQIIIDNNAKTISLPIGSDLIVVKGSGAQYYRLAEGYSMSYANIIFDSSLTYLYLDMINNELKLKIYTELYPSGCPIIAKLVTQYGTGNIISAYDCSVPVSVNGKMFNNIESEEIKSLAADVINGGDKLYSYSGEIISLNSFGVKSFKTLSNAWAQSMTIYRDYVIFFSNSTNKAQLYNISSGALLATFDIANGGYLQPHCNTAVIGVEFASENSIMPVIYISQWDAGYERACFVYDVFLSNNTYSMSLVQRINLSAVSSSLIGTGECDFVVDKQKNKMYAIAYKASNSASGQGISTLVCGFNLPLLSAGSVVTITDNDITTHFELDLIKYRQDAFMHNGKIYISYGGLSGVKAGIAVIDIETEEIVTQMPIYKYIDGEPECFDIYNNKMLYNYGTNLLEIIL